MNDTIIAIKKTICLRGDSQAGIDDETPGFPVFLTVAKFYYPHVLLNYVIKIQP
jgi:hypothetical protein